MSNKHRKWSLHWRKASQEDFESKQGQHTGISGYTPCGLCITNPVYVELLCRNFELLQILQTYSDFRGLPKSFRLV